LEQLEERCLPSGGLAIAPNGDVWFRDISYVGRIEPGTGSTQYYYLPAGTTVIGDLAFAPDGNLWMNVGNGLLRFNPTTGTSDPFYLAPGRQMGMFGHLTAAADGNLWFLEASATANWVASIDSATGAIHEYQYNGTLDLNGGAAVAPDGTVWLAASVGHTNQFFPVQLNPTTGVMTEFPNDSIGQFNLVAGSDGDIWSYSDRLGFWKWDLSSQAASFFPISPDFATSNYMTAGTDGNIWIPLLGNGMWETINLERMNPLTSTTTVFSPPFGNNFGSVQGVAVGGDGTLWVANSLAIIHFDPSNGAFQEFPITGTPPGFSYAGNFIIQPPPGAILASGVAGIDWGDGTTSSPAVTVTKVTAGGEWNVLANHSYRFPGTYQIQVTMVFMTFTSIDVLQVAFTANIEASAPTSSRQATSNQSLAAVAKDIVGANTSTTSSATFYNGSIETSASPKAGGSSANFSATQVYQYQSPNPTVPIEGGMGVIQPADDPSQKKPAEFPLDEPTPLDSRESLPISRAVLPDRESPTQDPSSQMKPNSSDTLNFWREPNNPNLWDGTWEPVMLFFEEGASAIEVGQTSGGDDARGEIASSAFLASFLLEVFTDRGRQKMKMSRSKSA